MSSENSDSSQFQNVGRAESYTMAEAARLKGVSYHTVSRAVRRGTLPAQRIGKMAFITSADLQAWQPMVQRAPRKYRRRTPQLDAVPAAIDLASAERVTWAEQISTLIETIRWTAQGLPLEQHLNLLVERLAHALGMDRVTVWGLKETGNAAYRMASFGPLVTNFPEEMPLTLFPLMADLAARQAEADGQRPEPFNDYALRKSTPIMVLPLRYGGNFHGALIADQNGETFQLTDDQIVLARAVADQMAIALELESLRGGSTTVSR